MDSRQTHRSQQDKKNSMRLHWWFCKVCHSYSSSGIQQGRSSRRGVNSGPEEQVKELMASRWKPRSVNKKTAMRLAEASLANHLLRCIAALLRFWLKPKLTVGRLAWSRHGVGIHRRLNDRNRPISTWVARRVWAAGPSVARHVGFPAGPAAEPDR